MTKILVVEDNKDLAYGLRHNLEFEGYDVTVEHTGQRGLVRARNTSPELIILDLMLPGMSGFEFLEALRGDDFTMPILILTARGEESDKVRGLRMGADDYVTKPFGVMELIARVEALLRRGRSNGDGSTVQRQRFGDVEVDSAIRAVWQRGEPVTLTPKEFDLLLALLRRNGTVASRTELMREVWGYSSSVVSRTVDTHIAELRRKIEDNPSSPRHVLTVRKAGYRLSLSPDER